MMQFVEKSFAGVLFWKSWLQLYPFVFKIIFAKLSKVNIIYTMGFLESVTWKQTNIYNTLICIYFSVSYSREEL